MKLLVAIIRAAFKSGPDFTLHALSGPYVNIFITGISIAIVSVL